MRYFGPRGIVFLQAAAVDSSTGMDKVADKREKKRDSSICLVVHNQSDRIVPFSLCVTRQIELSYLSGCTQSVR